MRHNKLALYVHLIWTTWDRMPLIDERWEGDLYRVIEDETRTHGCKVLAMGGISDHVHLLIEMPATVVLAEVVKQIKGVSSHTANERLMTQGSFKWQASYAAFTVSRWDVARVKGYIKKQKEHHYAGSTLPQLEIPEGSIRGGK